jgi:hypothetical protein
MATVCHSWGCGSTAVILTRCPTVDVWSGALTRTYSLLAGGPGTLQAASIVMTTRTLAAPELDKDAQAIQLLRDAREEIHGASYHDLDDAGDLNA